MLTHATAPHSTHATAPRSTHATAPHSTHANAPRSTHATAASLKRLGLEYVDLLFCHRPDPETPIEETVRAMNWVGGSGMVPSR